MSFAAVRSEPPSARTAAAQKTSTTKPPEAAADDTADLVKSLERERETNEQLERQLQDVLAMWEREAAQARTPRARVDASLLLPLPTAPREQASA